MARLRSSVSGKRRCGSATGDLQRPSRDDFARMMLHLALDQLMRDQNIEELARLQDGLVRRLVSQGFDRQQCHLVFEDLLDKYKKGGRSRKRFTSLRRTMSTVNEERSVQTAFARSDMFSPLLA